MDFKNTSIKKSHRRALGGQHGFTMSEFMIAVLIGGIALSLVASMMWYTGRTYAAVWNYVELDMQSRVTLDTMINEIRQVRRLKTNTVYSLTFEDKDGGDLEYVYDPVADLLIRKKDGIDKILLEGAESLEFQIFQRTPIGGTYNQYPTADASTCKLVQLKWTCVRDVMGQRNTESVQSAKIVIRNQ